MSSRPSWRGSLEACREAGTPQPELRYEATGLWVVFPYLPEHGAFAGPVTDEVTVEVRGKTPVETPVETPVKPETPVKTPVETAETPVETVKTPVKTPDRIVELLRADPQMTLTEVAEEIGRSRRAVERATARLIDAGRLRFVGPRKSGHWEVLK